ncbi:MAG: hypothetical protein ABI675_27445 [Chitinophagaceae bacterium]
MKPEINTTSTPPVKEGLTLLTRLIGLGIAGFSYPPILQEEEEPITAMKNHKAPDKTNSHSGWCQNQKYCREPLNGQPGEYNSGHPVLFIRPGCRLTTLVAIFSPDQCLLICTA